VKLFGVVLEIALLTWLYAQGLYVWVFAYALAYVVLTKLYIYVWRRWVRYELVRWTPKFFGPLDPQSRIEESKRCV